MEFIRVPSHYKHTCSKIMNIPLREHLTSHRVQDRGAGRAHYLLMFNVGFNNIGHVIHYFI